MEPDYRKGLVSVGIPSYNRPDALKRALSIITSQTYSDIEIVVSDNASPDNRVRDVVEEYLSIDKRIRYFRQEQNLGVLANADFVLKNSHGEYFMWFSDDDWRSPQFIEILVAELEENKNIEMAFCDYREVYEDGSYATGYPKSHLRVFKPFTSPHRFLRRIAHYLQNGANGKCNLFYSLFRKKALDELDLKKISGGFKYLNMDCLLVYSMLGRRPAIIREEKMCALTCGNKKHYVAVADDKKKRGLYRRISAYIRELNLERKQYVENSNSIFEYIIIQAVFLPKLLYLILSVSLRKLNISKSKEFTNKPDSIECENSETQAPNGIGCISDNNKLDLPNVTLVAMATRNAEETLQAIEYSCKHINFGSVRLISHYTPYGNHDGIEFFRIEKCKNIDDWSYKIIYELNDYIETEFALLVHADGFVVNPDSWRSEFLEYDYIGAPWPLPSDDFSYRDIEGNIVRVGNSVSLRSKRLLELPIKLNMPWEPYHGYFNEDGFICVKNKHIYESHGMKLAHLDIAKYFSHEAMIPEIRGIKPFMFHKWAGSNRDYPRF